MLQTIGNIVLNYLAAIGRVTLFSCESLLSFFKPPFYMRQLLKQMAEIGFFSLPVIGLTAIFTGAVLALQSYSGFQRFSAESSIPIVVVLSITRELGPVLASLMVAGRVGASIAAEIGTMKVTEQIDALRTLSTNPLQYLIAPRIVASIIVLPLLVIIADIIGIMGGYVVSVYSLDFNSTIYIKNTFKHLETMDVVQGLAKAAVFGFIISSVSSYCGYNSTQGAQGVGRATTTAVVFSSILILLVNYFLTQLFFV